MIIDDSNTKEIIDTLKYEKNLDLTTLNLIEKKSASPSDVWICSLKNDSINLKVAVKITKFELPKDTDKHTILTNYNALKGLSYETSIYRYIHKHIISKQLCWNFVSYIGLLNNTPDVRKLFNLSDNYYTFLITMVSPNIVDFEKTFITVNENDKKNILIQLSYTCLVLEKFSIMHGDLHLKNIILEELREPTVLCYTIDNHTFSINTKHVLRIFDWDRSYCQKFGLNTASIYNNFIPREDLRRTIHCIGQYYMPEFRSTYDRYHYVKKADLPKNVIAFLMGGFEFYKINAVVECKQFSLSDKKVIGNDNLFYGLDSYILNNYRMVYELNKTVITEKQLSDLLDLKPIYNFGTFQHDNSPSTETFLLTKKEISSVLGDDNVFRDYDLCYLSYHHRSKTLFQPIHYHKPNILSSFPQVLDYFKSFTSEVNDCKSELPKNIITTRKSNDNTLIPPLLYSSDVYTCLYKYLKDNNVDIVLIFHYINKLYQTKLDKKDMSTFLNALNFYHTSLGTFNFVDNKQFLMWNLKFVDYSPIWFNDLITKNGINTFEKFLEIRNLYYLKWNNQHPNN